MLVVTSFAMRAITLAFGFAPALSSSQHRERVEERALRVLALSRKRPIYMARCAPDASGAQRAWPDLLKADVAFPHARVSHLSHDHLADEEVRVHRHSADRFEIDV